MRIRIAENIKKYRIARGFTQSELALLLSVSPQAVSRWENGQAFPDITLLPKLAKYLNVTIDEIMGSEGQRSKCLKKEVFEREMANIDDESERVKNELRILEIYEELAHTELPFLIKYFRNLMDIKAYKRFILNDLESRIEALDDIIPRLVQERGVDEVLKAHNALQWTAEMNNIKTSAEEIVLREVIFV